MRGEREEVRAERCHVYRLVRDRLRAVGHHQRAPGLRQGRDLADRRHRAGDVGLVGDGDDFGPVIDQLIGAAEVQTAVRSHAEPAQGRAGAQAQLLPGHQVRVMLHLGDQHLVTGADAEPPGPGPGSGGIAHRIGDQVQCLGRALGEHDLAGLGADEGGNPGARALVGVGCLLAEQVRAAVRRRVVRGVELALGVEHLARLVRGGAGIQVDQRVAAAHGPGQDGEVRPHRGHVECGRAERIRRRGTACRCGAARGGTVGCGPVPRSGPGSQIPRGGCHAGAPAFFTNSSYPLVSSSSASSAPPCLTIRPPTKTCTKSGFTYRRIRV